MDKIKKGFMCVNSIYERKKNMKQAFNPYLPSYEYIPDGEPRVFGNRIYIFGSHDLFDGADFCLGDYVCWSASVEELGDWRFEGTIYRRNQDPLNLNMKQYLYAPDVVQGTDGRFYLYYALNLSTVISVAVCDTPAGQYEFLGHVHDSDGNVLGSRKGDINNFDPGVLVDDDGKVYLYTGFAPYSSIMKFIMKIRKRAIDGSYCVELEQDMVTMKTPPVRILGGHDQVEGSEFTGHGFFEASSMRKIHGKYYFIYSSEKSHELCYAISDRPNGGFSYGGTIISNGDVGLSKDTEPTNYWGNNHGSIVLIKDNWYVFYHRQTNQKICCRQGCAEAIEIKEDGSIPQVEMTSCGLNNGPLSGTGTYEARIACNLSSKNGAYAYIKEVKRDNEKRHPYLTQSGIDRESDGDQYIANMMDGSWAQFKYFDFHSENAISIEVRGNGKGCMVIRDRKGGDKLGEVEVRSSSDWNFLHGKIKSVNGVKALCFTYEGEGKIDFKSFSIHKI